MIRCPVCGGPAFAVSLQVPEAACLWCAREYLIERRGLVAMDRSPTTRERTEPRTIRRTELHHSHHRERGT